METFTLVIWMWGGLRLEEARRPGLSEIECKLQAAEVRRPRHAKCVTEPISAPPVDRNPICANCGNPPGRKLPIG